MSRMIQCHRVKMLIQAFEARRSESTPAAFALLDSFELPLIAWQSPGLEQTKKTHQDDTLMTQ